MLDRVLNLAGGNFDRQANTISVELLDLSLHRRIIESEEVVVASRRPEPGRRSCAAADASGTRAGRAAAIASVPGMDVEQAIHTRRTHKAYEREPVDHETVAELLELARWAPNHQLTQPWRFRVLGPEAFARLVAAGKPNEAEKLGRAPTLVVASAKLTGDDYQNREDVLATACAVYIVLLAAHARGLASYWRTPALFETPEGRAAVGLEESEEFVALIHLGHPATTPSAKDRNPIEDFVTFLD